MKNLLLVLFVVLFTASAAVAAEENAKPPENKKAAERAELLKKDIDKFWLTLRYYGPQDKPYYSLHLYVPQAPNIAAAEFSPAVRISKEQAAKIIDYLVNEGFLESADNIASIPMALPQGPCYGLWVWGPKDLELYERLWGLSMFERLDGLRKVLDGDAAKAMDGLLKGLEGHRKEWEKAAERAELLKKDIDNFWLTLRFLGPADKPYYTLDLYVPEMDIYAGPFDLAVRISKEQAAKIIDHLEADGFLESASNVAGVATEVTIGPCYSLLVRGPEALELCENLGWELLMLKRLDGLRTVLDGDAAKAMDKLLDRLSGHRKEWEKGAAEQAGEWGEAVAGLRGRLTTDKKVYRVGDKITFTMAFENVGDKDVTICQRDPFPPNHWLLLRREDGTPVDKVTLINVEWEPVREKDIHKIPPGKVHSLQFVGRFVEQRIFGDERQMQAKIGDLILQFDEGFLLGQPGVFHASFRYAMAADADIVGKFPQLWTGIVNSSEVKIEVLPAEADKPEQEPAAKWGEAVEGVQVQLTADKRVWKAGEIPTFQAEVRNNGPHTWAVAPLQELYDLQWDGKWYPWTGPIDVISPSIEPGKGLEKIPISAAPKWRHLELTPGKHTVCIRTAVTREGGAIKRISNAVEIEILPAGAEEPAAKPAAKKLSVVGPPELFPVRQGGRYGFINETGKVVIEPKFDWASTFHEGLAQVKVGQERGYIDKAGKIVIAPQFARAWDFSEGLARVEINNKDGFVDKTGRMVIESRFTEAGIFSEGLAPVKMGGRRFEFNDDGRWGFIDKTGEMVIKPEFNRADSFSEGLAAVQVGGGWGVGKWGYVDKTGKMVIRPQFDYAYEFSEGLAAVEIDGKYGYIDKTGKVVIKLQFDLAHRFSEGLAAVNIGYRREEDVILSLGIWGYIDKTGKTVIPVQFDHTLWFSEGLANVKIGKKAGFIDKTGKIVIEPEFDVAGPFRKGLAEVRIDGKSGYIDKTGKYVWKPSE